MCGALRQFPNPSMAQAFVNAYPTARLWGLTAFDGDAQLFLPRLEIFSRQGKCELTLNLFSEEALSDDAQAALAWLENLLVIKPIENLQVKVLSVQHQPERSGWEIMLRDALKAINRQQMDKVVLARSSVLTLESPLFAPAMMAASRRVNHQCYHFMLRFDAHSAFLGSSPERLYLREGKHLLTEALAGTVANHPDERQAQALAQWLLQDGRTNRKTCWWLMISASACKAVPERSMCCHQKWYGCARYSICGGVLKGN